jgi:Xaa-Pro dipeptidase
MEKHGLDAVVASTPENVLYTTDFYSRNQWDGYYDSAIFAVLPQDKDPGIVSPKVQGLEKSWIRDLNFYGKPALGTFTAEKETLVPFGEVNAAEDIYVALLKLLRNRGLDNGKIGFDRLGTRLHERLHKDLPKAKLLEADWLFEELRCVKSEDEISKLKQVVRTTEVAIETAIRAIKQDIKDDEIRQLVNITLIKGDAVPVTTIARGGPMTTPTRVMKNGDPLWFDVVAVKEGYRSDIGRTAVLGEPSPRFKKYYDATFRGQEAALDSIRAGVRACDVFDIGVKTVIREAIPHYKRHAIGHGIGLGFDRPVVAPNDETVLEEGMVLCIETPYREIGFGGMMLEDTVVVKSDGFDFLSSISRDLYTI